MKLTQRLLVLLITVTMMLSGSFVQAFAAEEAVDGGSVVASETAGSEDKDEAKEEAKEEAKAEEAKAEEAKETAPEREEPKAKLESKAEPEKDAAKEDSSKNEADKDAEKPSAGKLTFESDEYTVTLEYGKKAEIPEGTKLEVREVMADSDSKKEQKEYAEYYDKSLEQLQNEKGGDSIAKLEFAKFYDITLISKGKEIEPKGDVSVKFEFNKDARETVGKKDEAEKNLRVVHLTENEKTGKLEAAPIDKKDTEMSLEKKELAETSFTTDSFSVYGIVYTVDFEYDTKQAGKTETVVEAKGKTFRMEAAYDSDAGIPAEGVRLSAKELKDADPDAVTFDIKIVSESDENVVYQPAEGHNVALTVVVLDKKADTDEDTASVLHVSEDGTEEMLTADLETTDEGYVYSFETESFSTFTLYRNHGAFSEYFNTTVKVSRFTGRVTELTGSAQVYNDNNDWLSFDEIIAGWNSDYSYTGSNGRYSVLKANDNGNGTRNQALCAVGFFRTNVGTHVSLGRYAVNIDTSITGNGNVNGSASNYDLQIELNDNSLPVRITENGTTTDKVFLPSGSATSYTAESIADALGYSGSNYMVASSTINGVSVESVSRAQLTGTDVPTDTGYSVWPASNLGWWTKLLAGETFSFGSGRALAANYPNTNISYPAAYKWTYINGGTETVIGDTPYEIKIIPAVAQVSNDGGATWKKFACLISGEYDGEQLVGAFDYANSLTGDVIVEMLFDEHERYTLGSGFTFNNTDIDSLTINGVNDKSTLTKNQTTESMITTSGIDAVEFSNVIFNGNGPMTVDGNGGAVLTDAGTLTVSNCEFNNCQAGRNQNLNNVLAQGGGIYHSNTDATVEITNTIFKDCRANGSGPDQTHGGAGGGFFTNAKTLTVTDSTFENCTTRLRMGAGFIQQRANGTAESSCTVTKCIFTDCVAAHGGGGFESDAWHTTIEHSSFSGCKAGNNNNNNAKGGAVNVWADGNDQSTRSTTLIVEDCAFEDCTSKDNGGAVRSTALNTTISESSFSGCISTNDNGGAVACTNSKPNSSVAITDCTFNDCHADNGNGGAITSAASVITTVSETSAGETVINGCSAKKGGAIFATKLTMTGGTVTGNTTSGESAAVDASSGASGLTFSGDVVIEGNTGSSGEARDVYIGTDTDRHILVASTGLGDNASIGVYVADANSAFDKHGKPNQLFAWVGRNSGNPKASAYTNLDKFFSDRLDNGPMRGKAATAGENYEYRVMWAAPICKIVDDNGEHPFDTLRDALAFARGSEITTPMSASNPVKIEMLVDYVIPQTDKVTLDQANDNIIITTAATSGGVYNFKPTFTAEQGRSGDDSNEIAILQRGFDAGTAAGNSLFYLNNSSAKLKTEDITIDGGYATESQYKGRAVYVNNGDVCFMGGTTVQNCRLTGGSFTEGRGSAVYINNGGTHTIIDNNSDKDVIFRDCSVNGNQNYDGACINVQSGSVIINNSGSGAVLFERINGNSDTDGGAIGIEGSGDLTVNNTEDGSIRFVDCTASYGGALETDSGNITLNNSGTGTMEFLRCYTDYAHEGGAIYAGKNCTVINNGTINFTGTIGTDAETKTKTTTGGAIYAASALSITGSGQTSFTNCKASGNGGAIYAKGSVTIDQTDGTSFTNCTGNNGGGVYGNSTVSVTNGSFTNCTALTGTGGGIYSANKLSVSDSTFTDCSAKTYGGAIYINGPNSTGRHTISNCTFDGHKDLDENTVNAANGGAIYVNDGWLTLTGSQFSDLTCTTNGGAVYMDGRTSDSLTIEDCTFDGHDTLASTVKNASAGGAVYMNADSGITLKDITVSDCWTSGNGGGVYTDDAITSVDGTVAIENCYTTGGNGGGAYFYSTANLTGAEAVTFKNCHADSTSTSNGGGGAWFNNTATLDGAVSFEDCYTGGNGGAMYFVNGGTMTGVKVDGHKTLDAGTNNAVKGGTIFLANNKTLTISGGEIKNCSASDANGGAINVGGSSAKVFFEGDAVVYDNKSTKDGQEVQANMVLDQNNNTVVNTTATGLGTGAHIGVYVTGTASAGPFKSHGDAGDDFGTYNNSTSGKANLDRFKNDRVSDSSGNPLSGEVDPAHNYLIRWHADRQVAPTAVNQKYLPYILVLIAGAVLAAIAVIARRRREDQAADVDE